MSQADGVVLITGAARGIGRATAVAFARTGADLLLVDACSQLDDWPYALASRGDLAETARRCGDLGSDTRTVVADVRIQEDLDSLVQECERGFGPIVALINNAGIIGPAIQPAHEFSERVWQLILDIDLSGAWRCAKSVLPHMARRHRGCIVNVASTGGLVAFRHFAPYVVAKHGVVGLTRALALDYAPYKIRVNAVCPTLVADENNGGPGMLAGVAAMLGVNSDDYSRSSIEYHPLRTLARGADVAEAIVWLASDAAQSITGTVLPIDGGFTAQ